MYSSNSMPISAVIFDLDGVITKTSAVHAQAWKEMFDAYLRSRAKRYGEPFHEFTTEDYLTYVDGKPRYKGVQSFLQSRGIDLAYGAVDDRSGNETICGLGNRKNTVFTRVLNKNGVEVYESTISFVYQLKRRGVHVGVASSGKNCQRILEVAGLLDEFETRVDGVVTEQLGLHGKPAGDIFVKAAADMGCKPYESVVVEGAVSGVQAGVQGGFGLIIGVAREDNELELKENGADFVVRDLKEVTVELVFEWFDAKNRLPQ